MPNNNGKDKISKLGQTSGDLKPHLDEMKRGETLAGEPHDILDEDEPSFNTVLEAPDTAPVSTREPLGRGLLSIAFILASLFGGVLGIVGNKFLQKPDELVQTRAELVQGLATQNTIIETHEKSLRTLETSLSTSKVKITKLEAALRVSSATNTALEKDITGTQSRLFKLEADLKAAVEGIQATAQTKTQAMNVKDSKTAKPAVERLSITDPATGAQKPAQKPDSTDPSTSKLVTSSAITPPVADASQQIAKTDIQIAKTDIKEGAEQIVKGQQTTPVTETVPKLVPNSGPKSGPKSAQEPLPAPTPDPLTVLQETFPREAMLEAVKAQEAFARKKPSLLQRALRKHVKIGNPSTIDHRAEIGAAQIAVNDGDISAALEHISLLNPPVRAAAAQWVLVAKKYDVNTSSTND